MRERVCDSQESLERRQKKGCIERMYREGVLQGFVDKMCFKDVLIWCVDRM